MKIIRFDALPDRVAASTPDKFFCDNCILMADSAWRPDRRPMFLPAEGYWLCELRPAVKIDRLGKSVSPKFASRYYSEYTLVNYLVYEPDPELNMSPAFMLDDALIHGSWMPVDDNEHHLVAAGLSASHPEEVKEVDYTLNFQMLDRAIAALSHDATFKTGDIIVLPRSLVSYIPRPDSKVDVTVDGRQILNFKIK